MSTYDLTGKEKPALSSTALPLRVTRAATTRMRRADPLALVAGTVCVLLVLLAVLGPYLVPYPPARTDVLAASQGPSAQHLLGTDALGRDVLSRLMAGARLSFTGPVLIVALSLTFGSALGILGAWRGDVVDSLLTKALNVLFAIPGVLVAIVFGAAFGAGFWAPVLALSLAYIPYIARVVRSAALAERRQPYVEAFQLAGMSSWRICTRHILRNVSPIILAQATIGFGAALLDFGTTSFLGVGVQPPSADWGLILSDGTSQVLNGSLTQSLAAGLLMVVSVVAFNLLGERLSPDAGGRR
jgi:peptide/nickel transport system permease protein